MSTVTHVPPSIVYNNDASYGSLAKRQVSDSSGAKNVPAMRANPVPFASVQANAGATSGAVVTPGVSEAGQEFNPYAIDPVTSEALELRQIQSSIDEQKIASYIPTYHAEASAYMKQFIRGHFGKDIDPDRVYLNEYEPEYKYTPNPAGPIFPPEKTEVSAGRLVHSIPLSQVAYANLYAKIWPDTKRFRITANNDPNQLWADQNSLIDPHDFYDSLHDLDFKSHFFGRIDQFYAEHGDDLRRIAQKEAVFEADAQHACGLLNDKDCALAQRAFNPGRDDRNPPKVFPFEIGGYQSNNSLVIAGEGRVLLYLRGDDVPLRGFDSEQGLEQWLVAHFKKTDDLNRFAAMHFSANDADGRNGGPGVAGLLSPALPKSLDSKLHNAKEWLSGLFAGSKDIHDDPFGNLARISQRHDKEDAEFDITSNTNVNERKFARVMESIPVPFVSGLADWFRGKTRRQQEGGKLSLLFDTVSFGVGAKFPRLSYGIDSGIPVWSVLHDKGSYRDSSLPYDPNDPDDPDSPPRVAEKWRLHNTNNWNKGW
jgi:hypothetical protein